MAIEVTVLCSVYNDQNNIAHALDSVLFQTVNDWEMIVIDDCSNDQTPDILKSYQLRDKRIKVFHNSERKGLTANLNFGLEKTEAPFVARIDSDDIWTDRNKLKKQLDFYKFNGDHGLVGAWAQVVDKVGNKLYQIRLPNHDTDIKKQLLIHNCFIHSSVMFKTDLAKSVGGYDEHDLYVEDYGLWLKLAEISKVANINETMVSYRINPSGITRIHNRQQIKNALAVVKRHRNFFPNYFLGWLKWNVQLILS